VSDERVGRETVDSRPSSHFSCGDVAERAGVTQEYVTRLTRLGILAPRTGEAPDGTPRAARYSANDVRRVRAVASLEHAGEPVERIADLLRSGALSLD
jgi:DNA-binding transcriptional MerR regulator